MKLKDIITDDMYWEMFQNMDLTFDIEKLIYDKCVEELEKNGQYIYDKGYIYNEWRDASKNKTGTCFNTEISCLLKNVFETLKPYCTEDLIEKNASLDEIAEYEHGDNDYTVEYVRDSMACMYNEIIKVFELFGYEPDKSLEIVRISDGDLWDGFFENSVEDFIQLFEKNLRTLKNLVVKKRIMNHNQ